MNPNIKKHASGSRIGSDGSRGTPSSNLIRSEFESLLASSDDEQVFDEAASNVPSTSAGRFGSGENRGTPSSNLLRSEFESLLADSSDDETAFDQNTATSQRRGSSGAAAEFRHPGREVSELDEPDEMILSMVWKKDRLGAACYDLATSELRVMEDTNDDSEGFYVTKALYRQCRPRCLVTIVGSPAVFLNALKRTVLAESPSERSSSLSSEDGPCSASLKTLKLVCKKEHNYERCLQRVRSLRLSSEPRNASSTDRITFLNSILNFACSAMIHALGSLLLFVDRHWNEIALEASGRPTFSSLDCLALHDLVTLDEDTYRALNIVQARDHPSFFKFGNCTTQTGNASLFCLFKRYCRSRPGVRFLWKTMQHPTRDANVLQQRLNAIEFFLNPSNRTVVENLSCSLDRVDRLTNAVLACCSGPRAKTSNWYKMHQTVSRVIRIADLCEEHADRIEIFKRVAESVTNEARYVKYFIEYIVDFGESRRERKLVVKPSVDPLLDELNHARRALPELLTRMAEKDMREHLPPSVTGCNMVYLPNIGYVLAINKWYPTPPDAAELPNLEFKFSINGVHYYKSSSARELDETVGDVILKIAIRQNRILQKLTRYARKHAGSIARAIERCAELDTLLAFAGAARDHDYARPIITESKVIDAKESRHPLLEFSTTFVPNDVRSGSNGSLIKILTGPNSCGKSVYLKQIGLLLFMAHVGSYVAAKSATIGTIRRISTQMSITESVGLNASSFLQNLRQINTAIRASTSDSVVLADEFDRGTSESSGSSLLAAVLDEFAARGQQCPHVFAATHAHAVLEMLPESSLVELLTFEYAINEQESLVLLHRLANGSASSSFAHLAARIAELDESVVQRSLRVFESMKQQELPSPVGRRCEALRLIVELAKAGPNLDLEQLKSVLRRIMTLK